MQAIKLLVKSSQSRYTTIALTRKNKWKNDATGCLERSTAQSRLCLSRVKPVQRHTLRAAISHVQTEVGVAGDSRFYLLFTIRQFSWGKLQRVVTEESSQRSAGQSCPSFRFLPFPGQKRAGQRQGHPSTGARTLLCGTSLGRTRKEALDSTKHSQKLSLGKR